MKNHRHARAALAAVLVLSAAGVSPALAAGNAIDRAFVRQMVPHHQMATEMAEMAKTDGEHAKIRRLARQIIKAQTAEIRTLKRMPSASASRPPRCRWTAS